MKNKNLVIWVAVIVVFFGALVLYSRSGSGGGTTATATGGGSGGSLVAAEDSFDFGTVSMAAGKVSHVFKLKNESGAPVTITKLYTSCMCTIASLNHGGKKLGPFGMPGHGLGAIPVISETINPGEEAEVEAVFDPAAHGPAGVGPIDRVVFVEQGDKSLQLQFKAVVTP